jgi:TP901 family phage tail tape measure protein
MPEGAAGLDLGNLLVHLKGDASHYDKVMRGAETKMIGTARSMAAIGRRMVNISKKLALAAVAYATLSTKAFASFEEQLANVSTMLDKQSMRHMPAYEEALKSMAVEFGEGTATLSRGLYDILSASIPANEAIVVLDASVRAAKAGMTSTAVAADAITTVINSYGLAAKDAGRVSDVLFATVKRGKLTFAELAPNIGKVAAMASTAGLSFEELSAAIATITRAGLQADLATTAIRAMLSSFVRPTDDAKRMAREFGFELSSATLNAIGLTGVLKKLTGATAEELSAIMPNVRALAGFAAALKQAEQQAEDLELMLNSTGLTQEAYEKMTDTLAHTLRRFWQAVKMVSVEVGERLAPAIEYVTNRMIENQNAMRGWAVKIVDGFHAMVLATEEFVKAISLIPAIWKEVIILIDKVQISILELARLNVVFNAINRVTKLMSKDAKTYTEEIDRLTEKVAKMEKETTKIYESYVKRGPAIESFFENIRRLLQPPSEETLFRQLVEDTDKWLDSVGEIGDTIKDIGDDSEKATSKIAALKDVLDEWATDAVNVWKGVGEVVTRAFDNMAQTMAEMLIEGKANFKDFAKSVMTDLTAVIIRAQIAAAALKIFPDLFPTGGKVGESATQTSAAVGHKGGVVGSLRDHRIVPAEVFVGAPRLHRGLASDEFPTILQRGETVVPRGRGLQPPNVIINNNTGQPMEQEEGPMFDGTSWVVNIVVDKINQGGLLRDTIKGLR